jgi:acyl-CoA reductase-like NAD-dependent aldehyde dehydrogenase
VSVTAGQHRNYVGGEWVDAASGETMAVLNPATGDVIAEVPRSGAEDVERAVDAARKALPAWLEGTPKDRMELLLKLADVIDEHADELARLESQNVGKPMAIAVDGYTSIVRREPLGLVAGITPWNYPLMMAVWKLGPALAAGNVQILKPAEQTPLTTLRFVELAQEHLPPGVLQVLTGDGVPVGETLVRHPEIRLVSLTGSLETGRLIAVGAAQSNLKRVHLELGGKAPMVVLDDADPAVVAEAIKIGGYWNSGQDCTASSRILVHGKVYDDVLTETVKVLEAMKVADPAEGDDVDMGPVISEEQRGRVLGFLERLDARATVVTGGESVGDRGFFVKPTVVADVEQDAEIVQDEVFGPVVTVQRFSSDEEAIELANGVRYGLAASVFSRDVGRALQAARRLEFGTVWVNEHLFPLASEMPHGGFKESGYGKDMSLYSLEEYTRVKHVAVKLA